jgi:GT2 family glycosyltransferase
MHFAPTQRTMLFSPFHEPAAWDRMSSSSPSSELNARLHPQGADKNASEAARPKVSLIVSTLSRTDELDKFLSHLDGQTYTNFELVIVDQNEDDRVNALLGRHSGRQLHVRSNDRGLSRGRNLGLLKAQGDILAIPDDDCWYPPRLLEQVTRFFEQHPEIDVLSIVESNPDGLPMVPKRPPPAGLCDGQPIGLFPRRSAWLAQSSMIFLRRRVYEKIGFFSAWMGVGGGTDFESGEETDYLLRALSAGFKMWFEPSIHVFHIELRTPQRLANSNYRYAVGGGGLMRRHGYSVFKLAASVCRASGGAAFAALRGDMTSAPMYLRRAKGLVIGYFSLPPDRRLNGQQRTSTPWYSPQS